MLLLVDQLTNTHDMCNKLRVLSNHFDEEILVSSMGWEDETDHSTQELTVVLELIFESLLSLLDSITFETVLQLLLRKMWLQWFIFLLMLVTIMTSTKKLFELLSDFTVAYDQEAFSLVDFLLDLVKLRLWSLGILNFGLHICFTMVQN